MTTAYAFTNLLAECRHVEGGRNVRLSADGRTALVASESEPGVTRHVSCIGVGGLVRSRCDCPAGQHWSGRDGVTPCRHAAGLMRRMSYLGLARFDYDSGLWMTTEKAEALTAPAPLPAMSEEDIFRGLPR